MRWITDRTYDYIYLLKNGADESTTYTDPITHITYTYDDIVDRGTLSKRTINRWYNNIIEMLQILLSKRIVSYMPIIEDIPSEKLNIRIKCTYTGQPIIINEYGGEYISTNNFDNPVYQYIKWFNYLINISGIDTQEYQIPLTTEFLTYIQLNDLEKAVQEAFNKLTQNNVHYSGQIMSGGYL